jgi:hypothetical protein
MWEECVMKIRLITISVAVALLAMFVAVPLSASAAPKPKPAAGTATFQGIAGTVTNLRAVYDAASNTTTISGRFTDTLGNVTNFTTNLLGAAGTCTILHLDLGPLDLNVLGLMVHLDEVVLDISAQAGSGNLLGNLLCAVAHLLDSGPLNTILADLTDLLNQIFHLLG